MRTMSQLGHLRLIISEGCAEKKEPRKGNQGVYYTRLRRRYRCRARNRILQHAVY